MKKTLLIITAIIFTTSFTSGQHKWQKRFSKNSKPYRSEITYNFIASCIEGGAEVDYCSCLFDNIVKNMKEAEFLKEETKYLLQEEFSDEFLEVMSAARLECN